MKNAAKGVTDAWLTGTHAELVRTKTLEPRFFRGVEPEGDRGEATRE